MDISPFDYINSICGQNNKKFGQIDLPEKEYNPYLTNKAFSLYSDTIFLAAEMNIHNVIPNNAHYGFYNDTVIKKKRFSKWPKNKKKKEIIMICEYHKVSYKEAQEMLPFLSAENLKDIEKLLLTRK